ncbi:Six-hairpin glycosidase-like protein [Blastocladiella britannica]|nr:Six-hairpin glycosidase-like protein [Blastocladiella britannica]
MNRLVTFMLLSTALAATLLLPTPASAFQYRHGKEEDMATQLEHLSSLSLTRILENLHPPDTLPGTVIASPSRADPDYFYQWTRDGALVIDTLIRVLERQGQQPTWPMGINVTAIEAHIWDYVELTATVHQQHKSLSASPDDPMGLAEPKYFANTGTPFDGEWGRPQLDGPALRAAALTRWVNYLHMQYPKQHRPAWIADRIGRYLYRATMPADTAIKRDLEVAAATIEHHGFDLWEEVHGRHAYTLVAQVRALVAGAELARLFNDSRAAEWYDVRARIGAQSIPEFFVPAPSAAAGIAVVSHRFLCATLNRTGGMDTKVSNVDIASVLAALHLPSLTSTSGSSEVVANGLAYFSTTADAMLMTVRVIADQFKQLYPINQRQRHHRYSGDDKQIEDAIGRYPEDTFTGGNPWFLATFAIAEQYYSTARDFARAGSLSISPETRSYFPSDAVSDAQDSVKYRTGDPVFRSIIVGLINRGDQYSRRCLMHMDRSRGGHMDEQMDRSTGYMRGARDLTWSYAAAITATMARRDAVAELDRIPTSSRSHFPFMRQST